jgi:hypothetical protein
MLVKISHPQGHMAMRHTNKDVLVRCGCIYDDAFNDHYHYYKAGLTVWMEVADEDELKAVAKIFYVKYRGDVDELNKRPTLLV